MASIDKINVKGNEYVINEDKWSENEQRWQQLIAKPTLIAETKGNKYTDLNTEGYTIIIVTCTDKYDGIHSVSVPLDVLPTRATTLQVGGGYEPNNLGHYYDCRISKGSFSGRSAYVQGSNKIAETTWKVYGY